MICRDWICGKKDCNITSGEENKFKYKLCTECKYVHEVSLCKTCAFGKKMVNGKYLCKKDNTYGLI